MESVRSVSNLCVHLPRNTEFRQKRWTHDDRSLDLDSLHTSRWSEVFNDTRRAREMQGERETEERESEGYDKWVRRSRSMGRVLFKVLLSWEEGEGKYEKTVFLSILLSLSLSLPLMLRLFPSSSIFLPRQKAESFSMRHPSRHDVHTQEKNRIFEDTRAVSTAW